LHSSWERKKLNNKRFSFLIYCINEHINIYMLILQLHLLKHFNMLHSKYTLILLLMIVFSSCNIEPQAIVYGKDQCHFCKMNIVDSQHAAQYVTKKGKQFKFDAIECMVNQVEKTGQDDLSKLLVSDYGASEMTDALSATYLISKGIKSPMGAYLSGFSSIEKATAAHEEHGGKIYSWSELKIQLATK